MLMSTSYKHIFLTHVNIKLDVRLVKLDYLSKIFEPVIKTEMKLT